MSLNGQSSWLDEYEKLMFGTGYSEKTMSYAADMKKEHMPELLFKYRCCSSNSFEALEKDFLYSSQPSEFNDIFEGAIEIKHDEAERNIYQKQYDSLRKRYPFLVDASTGSARDLLENMAISFGGSYQDVQRNPELFSVVETLDMVAKQRFEELVSNLQHLARNMYNICCFCAENDNETMWAYYADSHKGFCIGYDIKSLNNDMTHLTFPVLYKDHCTLQINDIDHIDGSVCMHMATEKSVAWSHEKEWRTFFPSNPPIHRETMPPAKAVYLGARISEENESRLINICRNKQIDIFKMVPQISEYKLVPIPI